MLIAQGAAADPQPLARIIRDGMVAEPCDLLPVVAALDGLEALVEALRIVRLAAAGLTDEGADHAGATRVLVDAVSAQTAKVRVALDGDDEAGDEPAADEAAAA